MLIPLSLICIPIKCKLLLKNIRFSTNGHFLNKLKKTLIACMFVPLMDWLLHNKALYSHPFCLLFKPNEFLSQTMQKYNNGNVVCMNVKNPGGCAVRL